MYAAFAHKTRILCTISAFCNVVDLSDAHAQVPTDQPEVALSLITEFAANAAAHFRK